MRHLPRLLVSTFIFWLTLHLVWTVQDGLHDTAQPADCLLVLGNTVNADGSLSDRLRARLDKALALYRGGLAPKIVVSGGLGKEGHYEGLAMGQYLVEQGVPRTSIIVDNLGNSTRATASNFAAIAARCQFRSVVVVSQFYHLSRCRYLLQQAGTFQISTAHADYYELRDVYSLLREFPAYYVAMLRQ
ncbi:YdcF family protein [Hymenobacter gummosus]|uniref:YdcF family protein n=1 Tax=Hymenobacter gummosus TaxID=1776032 RepID=A0A3S0J899_9BACT|nr:YdcF family protein [Hymenobacter gummosus]RTQ47757.1 YdcF family protein [Hymenobacter gummosus]